VLHTEPVHVGTGKCKLPSTSPNTGLNRIKHETVKFEIYKHPQMCSYDGNHGNFVTSFSTTILLCLWYLSSIFSTSFLLGGFSIPHMNTVESPLGYEACFLNVSFDVISVICRLHNLRSPFKIPFYLVPPIVFSFRVHALFYLGTICRFSWNGTNVSH
jgi:hypothetical protein